MERIGQAVLADLNALRLARGRGGAVGNRVQAFKSVVNHCAAVHSTVQRRVDGVGVRAGANLQRIRAVARVHEELEAQRGGAQVFQVLLGHINIHIVVNRAQHPLVEDDVLSLMHHLHARLSVAGGLDLADQAVELGVGPLGVVVAAAGDPHIQEADGVVVVAQPAVAGNLIVAVLTGVQEGGPLLALQRHCGAQLAPHLLQRLADLLMGGAFIVQIGDGGQALAVGIAGLSQQLLGLGQIGLVGPGGRVIIVAAHFAEGRSFRSIAQALGHERAGRDLAGFANLLADIVAVDRQRERLADQRIVKRSGLRVVAHIVGADLALFVELRRGRQRVNLVVGDSVDEIQFAGLECRQLGCVILHQRELQGVRASQAVHVPVVLVLDHRDVGAGHPLSNLVGAVADVGGSVHSPGFAVCLNSRLLNGSVRGERGQLQEIRRAGRQRDLQRVVVQSFDLQRIRIVSRSGVGSRTGRGRARGSGARSTGRGRAAAAGRQAQAQHHDDGQHKCQFLHSELSSSKIVYSTFHTWRTHSMLQGELFTIIHARTRRATLFCKLSLFCNFIIIKQRGGKTAPSAPFSIYFTLSRWWQAA